MIPETYTSDYIINTNNVMKIEYIGNDYVRCENNVFGTKFVGENKCFNQKNFVCPFKK